MAIMDTKHIPPVLDAPVHVFALCRFLTPRAAVSSYPWKLLMANPLKTQKQKDGKEQTF